MEQIFGICIDLGVGLTAYCNKKNGCCLAKTWGLRETAWTHLYILNKLLCKQVWTNNTEGPLLNKQAGNLYISQNGFGNLSHQKDGGINDQNRKGLVRTLVEKGLNKILSHKHA